MRSALADAAWAVEDRVVWGTADVLRAIVEIVKWPFERLVWAVENWFLWPVREETVLWSRWTRAAVLLATIALAAGAVLGGIVVSDPSGVERTASVAPEPAAATTTATPPPAHRARRHVVPPGQRLQGVAPSFRPESGGGVTKAEAGSEPTGGPGAGSAAREAEQKIAAKEPGPAPAGKSAPPAEIDADGLQVARQFSQAFVLYETGRITPKVREAFAETATPDLRKGLLRRPPRLPGNVQVPKAKVLNIVPGPSHGGTYTVSVSLLRVGITSELRLEMAVEKAGRWRVTDITG